MNSKTITIIGAGLYGCLTAWKLKNKFKNYQINLIDSTDHILSSYDAIKIGGNLYNNGFHGLELPRSEELYNFFQKTIKVPMVKFLNEKKLLIEGNLIDYTSSLKEYPVEIKKFFIKKPNDVIEKFEYFFDYISNDYKLILKKISSRYCENIRDSYHFLVPWFFPSDYFLKSIDEGYLFRDQVRLKIISPKYAAPKSFIFQSIQEPFLKQLRLIGVKVLLNTKVDVEDSGIFYKHDNKKFFLTKEDKVFFCNSPINILKFISPDTSKLLTQNSRILINVIIEVNELLGSKEFSEILCADIRFFRLSRISKIFKKKSKENTKLQLEIFVKPDYEITEIYQDIENYFLNYFIKFNFKFIKILGVHSSRTVFFPENNIVHAANNKVNSWYKNFPNYHILESFGPINMSKAWNYSEKSINYINKTL